MTPIDKYAERARKVLKGWYKNPRWTSPSVLNEIIARALETAALEAAVYEQDHQFPHTQPESKCHECIRLKRQRARLAELEKQNGK